MKKNINKYKVFLFFVFLIIIVVFLKIYFTNYINMINCENSGGKWHSWSYWQEGNRKCDLPFGDGGKECSDSKDCIGGECLYANDQDFVSYVNKKCGLPSEKYTDCLKGIKVEILTKSNKEKLSGNCVERMSAYCLGDCFFINNGSLDYQYILE